MNNAWLPHNNSQISKFVACSKYQITTWLHNGATVVHTCQREKNYQLRSKHFDKHTIVCQFKEMIAIENSYHYQKPQSYQRMQSRYGLIRLLRNMTINLIQQQETRWKSCTTPAIPSVDAEDWREGEMERADGEGRRQRRFHRRHLLAELVVAGGETHRVFCSSIKLILRSNIYFPLNYITVTW